MIYAPVLLCLPLVLGTLLMVLTRLEDWSKR